MKDASKEKILFKKLTEKYEAKRRKNKNDNERN